MVIALSKYPIKYLELVFVGTNFEITVISQIFIDFSKAYNLLLLLSLQIATLWHYDYFLRLLFDWYKYDLIDSNQNYVLIANWYKHFSQEILQ